MNSKNCSLPWLLILTGVLYAGLTFSAHSTENKPLVPASSVIEPLTILGLSEQQLDGAAALTLAFSIPLDESQDFSRYVKLSDAEHGNVDGGWELSANNKMLRFRHPEPARKLTVSVAAGLRAANGSVLAKEFIKTLKTSDMKPVIGFASRGSLLPTELAQGLPVLTLNVNSVDVDFFRIRQASLAHFLAKWKYRNSMDYWDSEELLPKTDLVYSGRFDLNPARNTREKRQLPLSGIKALKQPGVYLAIMKQAGSFNYSQPATIFTRSDLSISLHRFPTRLDLFVQSVKSGDPQKGVMLQLLDEKGALLEKGYSDKDGHLNLEMKEAGKLLLATRGEQTSLLDLQRPALDLTEFAITGEQSSNKQLFVFGPRDIYRPGETVIVNALMRDVDGKPLPAQPVRAEVVQPDGDVISAFVWQPQDGLYQRRFVLPAGAMSGNWALRLNSGDNQPQLWHFQVEDFMPERMALTLTGNNKPVRPNENVQFNIEGRYLYGAPAAGNRLQTQLWLRPVREAVATLPGYQFGNIREQELKYSPELKETDLKLGPDGKAQLNIASEWAGIHSPLNLIVQASLYEIGGRPVTRRVNQAIWPAPALPGIRPEFASKAMYDWRSNSYRDQYMTDKGSIASFDIVYANSEGEKLAADNLTVRLVRENHDDYWSFSESEGWQSRYNQQDLIEEQQQIAIPKGGNHKVSFPVESGYYRLEIETPAGLISSIRFLAGYSWQDNTNGSGALRPDQVKLKLDKASYQPGETARVRIEAPAAGKGYLMVESSDKPLWWQPVTIPAGGTTLEVPIDSQWNRHDLYLSAIVVRHGESIKAQTPKRAVGLLHLPLASEGRRLTLALEAPDKVRPEQVIEVKVKAKASSHGGQLPEQIHVLLSAVDKGVLNITNYHTPDPWKGFLGRKRYNADQYDVFDQLIEGEGRLATLRFGGDGESSMAMRGGKKPITHVNIVAQQLQPVTLNKEGEGVLKLTLPEFDGQISLMVQAWSAEMFGSAERKMTVAAPLISELQTPRFLAGGDQATLALNLTNLTGLPQKLKLDFAVNGLIAVNGDIPEQVSLGRDEHATLKLPVRALKGFGDAEITLNISGSKLPGETIGPVHRRWQIGVRPAYPAQTLEFNTVLNQGRPWQIMPSAFKSLEGGTLEGKLTLSNRPALNIANYIRSLYAYPYGCLEQTASTLWPSIFTNQAQLAAMGIKSSNDQARRESVNVGIAHLAGMQRYNGSFGLWSKNSNDEPWLSAYVTDFLLNATEAGYVIPEGVIRRANERLLRYLQNPEQIPVFSKDNEDALRFSVRAYAGMVLARQQLAPLGVLRALYDKRNDAKSGLALVQLGVALKLMGDEQRAQHVIMQGAAFDRPDDLWFGDYGSVVRDRAMIIALLSQQKMLPEEQNQLLISLVKEANGKQWFSTQENSALVMAARTIQQSDNTPWKVSLEGVSEPFMGSTTLNTVLNAERLLAGTTLTSQRHNPLYANLVVAGYPQNRPAPFSNVLSISRDYFTLDGAKADPGKIKRGDLLIVRLKISATKRVNDALVVDMLPAGLELENQNLSNTSASLNFIDDVPSLKESFTEMQQANIGHTEFRDDRFVAATGVGPYRPATLLYLARAVTPGSYYLPPPQVESMYAPEWRATGETQALLNVRE